MEEASHQFVRILIGCGKLHTVTFGCSEVKHGIGQVCAMPMIQFEILVCDIDLRSSLTVEVQRYICNRAKVVLACIR